MSIQEQIENQELLELYMDFSARKGEFNNSILALTNAIDNIEASPSFDILASQEEKDDITAHKEIIASFL